MEVRGDGDERIGPTTAVLMADNPTHRCTKNGIHRFRAHLFFEHFVHGVHHAEGADLFATKAGELRRPSLCEGLSREDGEGRHNIIARLGATDDLEQLL